MAVIRSSRAAEYFGLRIKVLPALPMLSVGPPVQMVPVIEIISHRGTTLNIESAFTDQRLSGESVMVVAREKLTTTGCKAILSSLLPQGQH